MHLFISYLSSIPDKIVCKLFFFKFSVLIMFITCDISLTCQLYKQMKNVYSCFSTYIPNFPNGDVRYS